MLTTEGLNDITEEPTSEWGEVTLFDDDDFDDELDHKSGIALTQRNHSSRPDTTTSTNTKRLRSKYTHQSIFSFSPNNLKRDPTIETIIESRKTSIIENDYTRLAQITSQTFRPTQNIQTNILRPKTVNQVHFSEINNQTKPLTEKQLSNLSTIQLDNDRWDDELNGQYDKESIASKDKSSLQVYEETCKRLNICPCSMIIRSLYTTKINLENYGLGTKGSQALAVALLRNTTVISLNLSGNNIGNSGMSHIYQILTENSYVEEYDLSYNNLGTKGIRKLGAAAAICVQLRVLNIGGNGLTGSDISIFLSKLEDHSNLKDLNISHNKLDEEGGIAIAKWLSDNNVLLNLDISWCSIRLLGARALAKSIGDNNKLLTLNLSNNSFTNETIELLINSLTRNVILKELNLYGNEFISRYDTRIKQDSSIIIIGKEALVYKMLVTASTNQALKIFRLGKNHLDARCIMIMLEYLSKLDNISLEELDLTGLTLNFKQMSDIHKFFSSYSKFTCYVGPIRQTIEHFTNNLLNLIHTYCQTNEISLIDLFETNSDKNMPNFIITYEQFRDGLKKAKIPYPVSQIENIIKYLGRDDDEGIISFRSLEIV